MDEYERATRRVRIIESFIEDIDDKNMTVAEALDAVMCIAEIDTTNEICDGISKEFKKIYDFIDKRLEEVNGS